MKRIILFFALLLLALVSHAQKVEIDMGDGIWVVCPNGDVNNDGALDTNECYIEIRDEQNRDITTSGGGAGTSGTGIPTYTGEIIQPNNNTPTTGGSTGDGADSGSSTTDPLNPGEIGGSTEPELPPVCRCNVCPDCGWCILAEGESLPEGCEKECECRTFSFSFKCIHSIISIRKTEIIKSLLWSIVNFQFRFITNEWSSLIDELKLSFEYIRVETHYLEGTLSHWSGDIKHSYVDRIIDGISNESISRNYSAHLTSEGYVMFWGINADKQEKVLYRNYATIEGLYIPSEIIQRDGIPKIGEPIEKVYHHKPVWMLNNLL